MSRRRSYTPVFFKVPTTAPIFVQILQEIAQSRAWVEQTKQPFDCPKDDKRLNPALSKGGVQCREHYRQCGEAAEPGHSLHPVQRLWDLLVTAVEHYCRAGFTDEASQKAADSLAEFARLMEEHGFPDKQFTYNLHICVCQLRRQEQARGAVSAAMEFVVERVMQIFKTLMGRRVCKEPEKPFTNVFLLEQALKKWRRDHPGMRTLGQMSAEPSWRKYEGPLYDRVKLVTAEGAQTYLLGKGEFLPRDQITKAMAAIREYVRVYSPPGWTLGDVDAIFQRTARCSKALRLMGVILFHSAEVNEENIGSLSYGRARSRINYYVQFDYPEGTFVAKVLHWLKVPHVDPAVEPLRLPIVTFYPTMRVERYDYAAAATAAAATARVAAATAAATRGGRGGGKAATEAADVAAVIARGAAEAAAMAVAVAPTLVGGRGGGRGGGGRGPPLAGGRGQGRGRGRANVAPTTQPTKLLSIDTSQPLPGEEYYAADPDTIANKMVVFFPGGSERVGQMYCASYSHLTSR